MTFCPDEKNARRSLAPMQGEGIIYSPKWYNKSGKPLENSNAVQPNNLSEVPLDHDSELGGDEPDNEVMSVPPMPNDVVGDGPIRTTPNPGRHPVLGLTLAQVAQVPAQVQAVKTPARTQLAADRAAARVTPTATPKVMLQGARSGRRRNHINPSMQSQTKNLLQR